ncbi:MAG: hypothetical protein KAQ66_02220 [Rhodospirillaceae bacterium]|nr:hypothetical protein [Rhodospirillaceae bacterium]
MKQITFLAKISALCGAMLVLTSCYLPQRFDAEIEIDAAGYYSMIFDGYIADVGLYQGILDGSINEEQEAEKVAVLMRDLSRDTAMQNVEYYQQGHFRVTWERKGDLLKTKTVTFLRRNESMISLKYVYDAGLVEVMGRSIGKADKQRLAESGLGMQGEIRVKSSIPALDHNATEVIQDKNDELSKWYVWRIKNIFQATPRLLLKIE